MKTLKSYFQQKDLYEINKDVGVNQIYPQFLLTAIESLRKKFDLYLTASKRQKYEGDINKYVSLTPPF